MSSAPDPSEPGQSAPDPSDAGEGGEPFGPEPGHAGTASGQPPRYERQGLLGKGGMGRVYAAHDSRLRRQVALKVAATPELAGRLAREAWITAQLEHPGIVAVYDAGETDGQAWYTMRLIRGRTLRDRISACAHPNGREALPARLSLLPHFHAACQAVAFAHSMGIVHRDLKPANIMVGEFGETQVADWGLARPVDEALPDWQRIVSNAGTEGVAGTPRYMSPEQARGEPAGFASDVFCLGAALHELLSGDAPPEAAGVPPDPESLPADVPRELVAIVRHSLRAEASERYPTGAELADDLGRWLEGRRVLAHEYEPIELLARLVRAWRAPLVVAGLALIGLTVVVTLAVDRNARERAAAEASLALALTQQALAALREERLPEAHVLAAHSLELGPSPEARGVLAATAHTNAELVWRMALPGICQHGGVVAPDASMLACHADGKLEVWGIDPLVRRVSLDFQVVEAPVWVGDRLLVATPDDLVWIDARSSDAGGAIVATTPGAAWRPLGAGDVAFATRGPEGRFLTADGHALGFPICTATRATTLVTGGHLVVGCDDGVLRSYDQGGAQVLALPLGDRPGWSSVGQFSTGLLVGWLDGGVQVLTLPDGQWGPRLPGSTRSVRELQPVPGTSLVLALGDVGGPRIWNTEVDAWVGSLPARASRIFPGPEVAQVLLLGDTLQLWQIAATPRPAAFQFTSGLSQAVFSPSGEALAVALGDGDVVERRLSDGRELRRWRWTDGVAKCVAYAADGLLVAAAMGAGGQVLGPGNELRPVDSAQKLRRAGRLADGSVWALSYADEALLIHADDGAVRLQSTGPGVFDGSSSPDGGTAAIVDSRGGVWVLGAGSRGAGGATAAWREVGRVPDAVAVDVGDGGSPLVIALRREVCIDALCTDIADDVIDVAWSGAQIAVATSAGDVWLLSGATGEVRAVLPGHTGRVSSVEFAPDGQSLVSGGWDGTARIWDLRELDMPAAELIARSERVWGLGVEEAMRGL